MLQALQSGAGFVSSLAEFVAFRLVTLPVPENLSRLCRRSVWRSFGLFSHRDKLKVRFYSVQRSASPRLASLRKSEVLRTFRCLPEKFGSCQVGFQILPFQTAQWRLCWSLQTPADCSACFHLVFVSFVCSRLRVKLGLPPFRPQTETFDPGKPAFSESVRESADGSAELEF